MLLGPGSLEPSSRMLSLSGTIRQQSRWWEKMHDEGIREKWIEEVKQQQKDYPEWEKLTDNMISYVVGELEGYAKLRDEATGTQAGPYEGIFVSDTLISQDVADMLQTAVKPLEDVPEEQKDWHPGSNGRVLDRTSFMFPLVYDETYGIDSDGEIRVFQPPEQTEIDSMFVAERFQWLPSDFYVSADAKVKLASPYINNISPEHHVKLVPVIERVMEGAIPLWERVLSDLLRQPIPSRINVEEMPDNTYTRNLIAVKCIWPTLSLIPTMMKSKNSKRTKRLGFLNNL
ncbi:hypothetical protein C8J56DRAFT_520083 [Mycena floridula]|nr:hypothetical protein C8J56DRAFT_520083 [Mycena floridula]